MIICVILQKVSSILERGKSRDLCITSPFDQFPRQAQILILEISNIFLWLKFSPSLNLNEIEHSAKVLFFLHKKNKGSRRILYSTERTVY